MCFLPFIFLRNGRWECKNCNAWLRCPLYLHYEESKKVYLRDIRKRSWILGQKRSIDEIIDRAFDGIHEEKDGYWKSKLKKEFYERLLQVTDVDWIDFVSGLTDSQVYYGSNRKTKLYCLMIRDQARMEC